MTSATKCNYTIAHTECSRGWGGQEIRIFSEMNAMRSRGHTLLLATPPDTTIRKKAEASGFPVFTFDDRNLQFPFAIFRAAAWFRRIKVQVVNTHSSRDGWIGGIAARLARVPLVIRSRHIEVDYPGRFRSRIAFHHLPHEVITTSEQISRRLIEQLGLDARRVTCVPTGVDLARFDPSLTGKLQDELNISRDVPVVGMISVLRSWKGHTYFLEAATMLLQQGRSVKFLIVGDGPTKSYMEQLVREKGLQNDVFFLGHREDVPNLLASLSVLVLPSTAHEGIPQIILQAQAMAKPVVGTTVGGIPEVVRDGETGLLVSPKDSPALAKAVERLLSDRNLAVRLGAQGRASVEKNHSLMGMCEKLEAIYERHSKVPSRP